MTPYARTTDKVVLYSSTNAAVSASAHTHVVFDAVGNVVEQDLPADNLGAVRVSHTTYDSLNRPTVETHEDGTTTQFAYTSTGLKYQVTDERANSMKMQYDSAGRAVDVISPPVDNGSGVVISGTTQTIYDADGNVKHTINPLQNEWTYCYDARNRKISEDEPATLDVVSGNSLPAHLGWGYDPVGNMTTGTDAKQQVTTKFYDAANRVVETQQPAVPLSTGGAPLRQSTPRMTPMETSPRSPMQTAM